MRQAADSRGWRQLLAGAAIMLCAWLVPVSAWAQSACTAVWGIRSPTVTTGGLSYLNTSTGQWSPILLMLPGNPNALAGSPTNGLLYFVDRNPNPANTVNLYSINLNAYPLAYALIGQIPPPPNVAWAGNIVAGTTDGAGNLFIYATEAANSPNVVVAQVSTATGQLVTPWTQVLTTGGAVPNILGYGDMFVDRLGTTWIATNTDPPTLHQINLNPGPSFGRTNSPALVVTGAPNHQAFSVSADPSSGDVYMGGASNLFADLDGPFYSVTFRISMPSGIATVLPQTNTGYLLSDMGNCAQPPATPTVTKTFGPASRTAAPGTSTLTISLGNPNTAPIYLTQDFMDALPAGLVLATPAQLAGSCVVAGNAFTAMGGATSITMAAGSRIPAGGCAVSVRVTAAATGVFVNTIPAGSLTTTAGVNAAAAQDTFQVGVTDFSMVKTQRAGTTGALRTTQVSVPGGTTLQYVLTIVNGAGSAGSGSVTFADTLPAAVTPVLSVGAVTQGAGNCVVGTSTVGNRTLVSGTFTTVPRAETCTVTITARVISTNVAMSVTNTATLMQLPISGAAYDTNAANNTATVVTAILPAALLTATKTNGVITLIPGGTTSYAITVGNQGPAAADGTRISDPAVTGLSCTSATCSSTGGASCPPAPLSMAQLQSTAGLLITSFPANSTVTFSVLCDVTATGL